MTFRIFDLPAEAATADVSATFRGHFLEIKLQKAAAKTEQNFRAAAA
jgi:HSP20 family molecular chaperone IbpA